MSSNKQKQLDDLAATILDNNICPELAAQATQLVFGDGSPDANIVFIGEAPGKNEDLKGKPFVGAAGKFLDEMLGNIGLERKDIYITNIVKYRPSNNRDPLPEEKEAFLPYLQAQLEIIQPKLVITLGRHSMNCFLPDLQISKVNGQPKRIRIRWSRRNVTGNQGGDDTQGDSENRRESYKEYDERESELATQRSAPKLGSVSGSARKQDELTLVILPLFHPAAALYNGSMRETLIEDFARIPAVLEIIENE